MSQDTQWFVSQEDQQLGPYTGDQMLSFAQGGNITRESLVWAEGMAEWLPAGRIDGLFPAAVKVAAATAKPVPAARVATAQPSGPMRAGATTPGRATQPAARSGQATAAAATQTAQAQGGNAVFPRPPVPLASFGLYAGTVAAAVVLALVGGLTIFMAARHPESIQPDPALGIITLVCFSLAGLCLIAAQVFALMNLYRAWFCLSRAGATVTPGMAVGLLFVPLFNVYWLFRAYYGFAQEWNRITHFFEDTRRGPKMSEGVFLAFCICSLILPPLAFILAFPVMAGLCNAINFIARRPLQARAPMRTR
ncbi:DUF4339 domain-containing protein [Luteolibacter flavescens]|uniref:DUF4339 domain-containing protein n=1 Tax=Luteolibacter flavescens TaxID=1859460 RepID=A0ABT3FJI9_9BACT|nr:DUF4339 domain-containing protein [Luteolibacter flavescens]MCW1883446.1 DUF4339 domain-containing protein [Luteolibacter flavescens]